METEPMARETMESEVLDAEERPVKKSPVRWIVLAGLVILLGAAAYVGGSLLNRQSGNGGGGPGISIGGNPGGGRMRAGPAGEESVGIMLEPSDDLPDRQPDTSGLFLSREDKTLILGTGKVSVLASVEDGQEMKVASEYDGPEVEVVVNNETEILADTTEPPSNPEESSTVKQKVEPGDLDEIGENSMVSVWGRKVGDRYIAEILVYTNPTFQAPPPK